MKRALLAIPVVLALAPAASANIVVQKSIGGIEVGATEALVKNDAGDPNRERTKHDDFSIVHIWTYDSFKVTFRQGKKVFEVYQVETTSKSEKTAAGVGVGSTEAAVKSKVPKVKCDTIEGFRSCHVGSFKPGRILTDFLIRNGKVSRVTLGRVVD